MAMTKRTRAPNGAPAEYINALLGMDCADCIVWPFSRASNGYATVFNAGKKKWAHRLVCEVFHGSPPSPKHEAAHSCGSGHLGCVNPRHLSWKTRAENQADRVNHGTHSRGQKSAQSRLTEVDIRAIRLAGNNESQRQIARKYGVGHTTVHAILRGRSWAWLQ